MEKHHCLRCGKDWVSRKIGRPERCGQCGAKYWWRYARPRPVARDKQRVGRPSKYPVGSLNIGQSMTLSVDNNALSIHQSIKAYGLRHGTRYEVASTMAGLVVKRVL